eukprot:2900573-Heterocapsa_arctica.AAC.1
MLKTQQIQTHKRAETNKAILEEEIIDKRDTEDKPCVIKNIKIFQNSIDHNNDRDRHEEHQRLNKIKAVEERENNKTNKIETLQEIQQAER